MEGRLRWVQKGYGGCTLSYQIRPGRRQMSSNHGAECNRRNRPFILTSARVSTTTHGAGHRRKWLISSPNHALRCSIPPPPHSTAHLRRRRSEVRPGCRESADEWRGVWSWPTPRVGPGVLLDIGAGPERRYDGQNPPHPTTSRAGHVEPAHNHGLRRPAGTNKASQRPLEHAECGQRATERPCEMISRGSRHTGRGAAGEGDGRRLTCACRALRPWCRGRRRLTSDGRCSGHSVRAQWLRAADLASHATALSDRRLGSLLGGHGAPPFAAAGPRRVQEGRGADRRSRMEAGTRAAGVLPPTI